MNAESQRQRIVSNRLAKKPRRLVASDDVSFVETVSVTVLTTFKAKSTLISHIRLRARTLQYHHCKSHKTPHINQNLVATQRHSVELTDDVIVVDRHGHRVLLPSYATLRIDQLPQFKEG